MGKSLKAGIFKNGESLKRRIFTKKELYESGNLENGESLKAGIFKTGNL